VASGLLIYYKRYYIVLFVVFFIRFPYFSIVSLIILLRKVWGEGVGIAILGFY